MSSAGSHGSTATRRKREKPQLVADELRRQILSGELADGESIGNEGGLIERFGVSRPSLREALRILETEGLITVVRGVLGGVVVHLEACPAATEFLNRDPRLHAGHRRAQASVNTLGEAD